MRDDASMAGLGAQQEAPVELSSPRHLVHWRKFAEEADVI